MQRGSHFTVLQSSTDKGRLHGGCGFSVTLHSYRHGVPTTTSWGGTLEVVTELFTRMLLVLLKGYSTAGGNANPSLPLLPGISQAHTVHHKYEEALETGEQDEDSLKSEGDAYNRDTGGGHHTHTPA